MRIEIVRTIDDKLVSCINYLLTQLSSHPHPIDRESLEYIINSPASELIVAFDGDIAIGMVTLCNYNSPTGRKYWIEDVVVNHEYRGKSIGRLLVEKAIESAHTKGEGTMMLTSRPSRIAANSLYRSMNFESKETNVYKLKI